MVERVISRDGTPIAYERSGAGPPLVLVHGTTASAGRWRPILPQLAAHFTVYAVDRRGRGESGDSAAYALEREFEDVAAVVDSVGAPCSLLGHSFGAVCALEAALLSQNLRRLVLYEPPLALPAVQLYPPGLFEQLQALLEAGDREGVVTHFMRQVVRMPEHEFEQYRRLPAWPARVAAAHTLPREVIAHERYRFDPQRLGQLRVPTLLLLGGDSPPPMSAATYAVDAALPNSRVVVLPGQQHIAIDTAPDLFAQAVLDFLRE